MHGLARRHKWAVVFVGGWLLAALLMLTVPPARVAYAEAQARELPFPEGALDERVHGSFREGGALYAYRVASYDETRTGETLADELQTNLVAEGWHIDKRWTPPNPGALPSGSVWIVEAARDGRILQCAAGPPGSTFTEMYRTDLAGPMRVACRVDFG